MKDHVECAICGKRLGRMNASHLGMHKTTIAEYKEMYPDAEIVNEASRDKHSKMMLEMHSGPSMFLSQEARKSISDKLKVRHAETQYMLGENHWTHGKLKLRGEFQPEEDVRAVIEELLEQDPSLADMAKECGVDSKTITNWLSRFGLQRGHRNGARCSWYRGGWRKERGPDWLPLRKQVLERDEYKCVKCGMTQREARETGHALSVHHKVPWRETHDNSMENLITVCQSCHMVLEWESGCWAK